MSHVVAGKLRKAPFIKENCGQDGQSKLYDVELAEVTKDWQTQEKSYTNYSALFFAKTPGAKDFYDKAFAEGSFIVVACEKLKTDIQQGNDGRTFVKLQMNNPRLESCLPVSDMGAAPQQQYQQPAQPQQTSPAYQQPAQQRQVPTPNHQPTQNQAPKSWGTPPGQKASAPQQGDHSMDFDSDIPF
jgi:single-stranded DNA-binding protein